METQQATIVPDSGGFRCSACGGGVRKDATSCKHCGRTFVVAPAAPTGTQAPAEPPQFCPSCGKPAVGDAQFCASCGKPLTAAVAMPVRAASAPVPTSVPVKKSGNAAGILVVVILLIAGLFALSFAFGGRPAGTTNPRADTIGAFVMCKQFVTDRLKAPSTAKFPSMADNGVNVTQLDSTKFKVSAFVDSQNSFGAMIRTHFDCTVRNTGGDNWHLDDLTTNP